MFISRQKINFILYVFLEILQIYCKLVIFGTLGMPGYTHPKRYYQVVENVCVYLQAKTNFIIYFFFEILHFKDSFNLIGQQHFGPQFENLNFARYAIDNEILITILVFI